MLQRYKHLLSLVLLPLYCSFLSAQSQPVFSSITEEDGLTNGFVTDIIQSANGYYYFATSKGLNRYDGYSMTSWIFPSGDSTNAPTNPVLWCLNQATDTIIYIGSQRGFSAFDPRVEQFQHFFHHPERPYSLSGNAVYEVHSDSTSEAIWIGTENGFCRYLPSKERFYRYFYREEPAERQEVYAFSPSEEDKIWTGVGPHLTEFSLSNDDYLSFTLPGYVPEKNEDYTIRVLLKDQAGILWIGTGNRGLYAFDPKKQAFIRRVGLKEGLRNLRIRSLYEDKKGTLWIGTYGGGLHFLTPDRRQVIPFERDKFNPSHHNFDVVYHIEEDRQGNLLLGTFYGGVKLHLAHRKPFRHYVPVPGKPGTLPRANFGAYYLHEDSTIWLPARADSFYVFDPNAEYFSTEHIELGSQSLDYAPEIRSFVRDQEGNIWGIGKRSMVVRMKGQQLWEQFLPEGLANMGWLTVQYIDQQQRHWVGTQSGLYRFDAPSRTLTPVLLPSSQDNPKLGNNQHIQSIEETKGGIIWVATQGGVNQIDDVIKYFPFREFVFDVEQDRMGRIWIGTIKGLARYDAVNERIVIEEAAQASQDGVVWGLMEDQKGRMWVVSNQGLHYFDPSTKAFRTYSQNHGLKNPQYFGHHLHLDPNDFFYGGTQGVLRFDPIAIRENTHPPQVVITGVELNNQRLPVRGTLADSTHRLSPLRQAPAFAKRLNLSHKQQDLTFFFAGLNITAPENNQYRYRLKGDHKDWIVSDVTQRKATYTNLSPGTYTFEVLASNEDGLWSKEPAALNIQIAPPWYWNPLAWLIYAGIFFFTLWAFYHRQLSTRLERQQQISAMEAAQEKARHLQELNSTRTQLFTNLSHEFRTPLTNILGAVELWNKHPQQWRAKASERIKRSAQELLGLVEQMLGIARLDSHTLPINWKRGDVLAFLAYVLEAFEYKADQKNITLELRAPVDEFYMDFDPDKWQVIVGNLLSNALKFTPEDGLIVLRVSHAKEDHFQFQLMDNGPGIAAEDLPHIFDRFYQANPTNHQGTGIGLAYTKELVHLLSGRIEVHNRAKQGAIFTVTLPVRHQAPTSFPLPVTAADQLAQSTTVASANTLIDAADKPTLLIVEDHAEVLDYLRHILGTSYHIYTALDGVEGRRLAIDLVPDLIISDLMMPRMDGLDLCRHLKTDLRTNHIPFLLLTAKADVQSRLAGLKTGADTYLAKPVSGIELQIRLTNLLENRERLKQSYRRFKPADPPKEKLDLNELFLRKAHEKIHKNLQQENFDVEALCRAMTISRTQLHNKLKALTGLSTTQFIRKTRIEYACKLLKDPTHNISEVAYDVSFKHLSTFNRAFKEWTQQTPSDFRQQALSGEK